MTANLVSILNPIAWISRNSADGDDLLGDAYEYLMRNFATESGKSRTILYTGGSISRNGEGNRGGKIKKPGRYHL